MWAFPTREPQLCMPHNLSSSDCLSPCCPVHCRLWSNNPDPYLAKCHRILFTAVTINKGLQTVPSILCRPTPLRQTAGLIKGFNKLRNSGLFKPEVSLIKNQSEKVIRWSDYQMLTIPMWALARVIVSMSLEVLHSECIFPQIWHDWPMVDAMRLEAR